jgi:hypothetical protein
MNAEQTLVYLKDILEKFISIDREMIEKNDYQDFKNMYSTGSLNNNLQIQRIIKECEEGEIYNEFRF